MSSKVPIPMIDCPRFVLVILNSSRIGIKELKAMRDGLRHAAACSAPSHLECPKFRRLMGLASAAAIGRNSKKHRKQKSLSRKQK